MNSEVYLVVEGLTESDAKKTGGFDRDILEWNIPEDREIVVL